ncbi:hypothetical protein VTJ49DRAFT_1681 [Mycothermus thermophilus]|uniref:PHD and RING finger domain-containing protein n=1 Tax=Humicola insolens TaxID=85995 RepID=A0ABR3VDS3_HUMIN
MADQCIICLEPLEVEEAAATPAPPASAAAAQQLPQEQQHQHQQNTNIDDTEPLAKPSQQKRVSASENTSDNNVAKIESCGHLLHDGCLREWNDKANSCPICRQAVHTVTVYDKVGGKVVSTREVEDKKQAPVVPDLDPREWMEELVDPADYADSRCVVCDSTGDEEVLLLCDSCDAAYHTHCIDLDEVPRGPWLCMECEHALGPDAVPSLINRHRGSSGRGYYFPRTQASMRRARQRARSDEWQGAWGRITGRVWDALELDLDYHDEEDSVVLEGLHRSRQLREREREEHERWQQRLNIASRLGARDVFLNSMTRWIERPQPESTSREERLAWGALEKARDMESRKRKSRSATAEPREEEPHHEPERKLKRPRTRRLPAQTGESSSSAARDLGSSNQPQQTRQPVGSSSTADAAPSFLSSLLREVEMSTPSDEEHLTRLFGPIPSVNDVPSPARSPSQSPGCITPPVRASSPVMTLSSHIAPVYAPPTFSPTRGLSLDSVRDSRSASPQQRGRRVNQSSPENSDSEHRSRRQQRGNNINGNSNSSRSSSSHNHGPLELRQPPTGRPQGPDSAPRSHNTSPSRAPLTREMKENISRIVRGALKPHWHSQKLTAEQYETINRDISRKLYEEVKAPEIDEETQKGWERLATQEVARAVASLQA